MMDNGNKGDTSGMKDKQSCSYYPVSLNISGRKCVVVGGGQVAWRKATGLLECGAIVEVISPDLCPELDKLVETGKINALRRNYRAGDLQGAWVVIAATDDNKINQEIFTEARASGILVNVVDNADSSDFIVPSCLRRGKITIAVSTAGSSPALARKIRTSLEKDFGEEYALLAELVEEVRQEMKHRGTKVNSEGWQQALDVDLMIDLIKKGEKERAKAVLLDKLKARRE
jgi:precorrin-2 dehydrogenase/sirohydrochlorin ferrochelatase